MKKYWQYKAVNSIESANLFAKEGWEIFLIQTDIEIDTVIYLRKQIIEEEENLKQAEKDFQEEIQRVVDLRNKEQLNFNDKLEIKSEPELNEIEYELKDNCLIFYFSEFSISHDIRKSWLTHEFIELFVNYKDEVKITDMIECKYQYFHSVKSDINEKFAQRGLSLRFQDLVRFDKAAKKIYRKD